MTSNQSFFVSPQAAAVYKQARTDQALHSGVGRQGRLDIDRQESCVYDAYSGPGRYEDEALGSPEILVDTAVALASLRSVFSVFSEKERGYCDRLREMLIDKAVDPDTYDVKQGPVERHIDAVVSLAADLDLVRISSTPPDSRFRSTGW